MCCIFFAFQQAEVHPFRLIVAANRDEFIARPTKGAHFWEANASVLAGIDLAAGRSKNRHYGTWLGVTKHGRFAFLTNYREMDPSGINPLAKGRGFLCSDFLLSNASPREYLLALRSESSDYNGFNLVVGDLSANEVWYFANRGNESGPSQLQAGTVYGLSNGTLLSGQSWHKVQRGTAILQTIIDDARSSGNRITTLKNGAAHNSSVPMTMDQVVANLLELLRDDTIPDDASFQELSPFLQYVSPICLIHREGYGTRTHTVFVVDSCWNARFVEVDRFEVDPSIVWNGKNVINFREKAGLNEGAEDTFEEGIRSLETRREFDFTIEFLGGNADVIEAAALEEFRTMF
ncbi:hypothetical protein CcCBS67573_g06586 [Chytriomyces confervae]|uniref:Uncharacterized protein n=1 Tax=Chytriomyces confervae TaxID=246404 RepID=A0A507F3X2_9FUNG|nr:hypothetical protein HDU80_004194 [Chytriomyces hyalinus]TPX70297.1 hypothetical protein CcCBS67573_g06586 [Chytriomyces confervae]